MANIRAGIAYVDVRLGSVEKFKKDLEDKVEKVGSGAGKKLGESMGEGAAKPLQETLVKKTRKVTEQVGKDGGEGFASGFTQSIKSLPMRTRLIAALFPAIVAAGPFLGASFGALLVSGIVTAGIGAGVLAAVKGDKKIAQAATELSALFGRYLSRSASRWFDRPVLLSLDVLEKRFKEAMPTIDSIFKNSSQYLAPLVDSISRMVQFILEGMDNAIKNAGPIFEVFRAGLERVGLALGEFFTKITEDPEAVEGMTDALEDLFGILVLVINWFGNFIVSASRAYAQFKDSWGAIKDWFANTIVPSIKRAGDQFMAIWNAVTSWWTGKIIPSFQRAGQQFMGIWNAIKNFLGQIPGWFSNTWSIVIRSVALWFSNMKSRFLTGVAAVLNVIIPLPTKIFNAFASLPGKMAQAAANAIAGFLRSFTGGSLIARAKSIANSIVSTIQGALGIASPSKVFEQIGVYTMQGFENGLKKAPPDISSMIPGVIPTTIQGNFGSVQEPQMDKTSASGLSIENYYANDNVDPWRQAEDWWFLVTSRGAIA